MARCRHGFTGVTVPCPVGCHGPIDPLDLETARAVHNQRRDYAKGRATTNQQILEALTQQGSLKGAAEALGISATTILNRSVTDAEIRQALEERRQRHPGHIDMTGMVIRGWTVLHGVPRPDRRSPTHWECRHSCGGVEILEGFRLRQSPNKYCKACRPNPVGRRRRG